MQTELVQNCPVCGSTAFENVLSCKDHLYSQELFTIQKCLNCNLMFTNPRPDQEHIERFYQSSDYISHSGKTNSIFDFIYLQARKIALANKFKLIKSHKKIGTILDFGCGTGEFLKYMSSRKWNGFGVEPAENARAKANQLLDTTTETVFEKLEDLPSTKFDIITLWHVLEHVPEPGRLLTSLKNILAKDGLIFVAVPNHESYDANYYKDHWAGYDVPRHFWHFASSQLQTLMKNQGLKLSTIAPMKLDAYYVSLLSEKYKNNGRHNLATPFNAFFRGLTSNTKAKKSMNYSSLIYIARHE